MERNIQRRVTCELCQTNYGIDIVKHLGSKRHAKEREIWKKNLEKSKKEVLQKMEPVLRKQVQREINVEVILKYLSAYEVYITHTKNTKMLKRSEVELIHIKPVRTIKNEMIEYSEEERDVREYSSEEELSELSDEEPPSEKKIDWFSEEEDMKILSSSDNNSLSDESLIDEPTFPENMEF